MIKHLDIDTLKDVTKDTDTQFVSDPGMLGSQQNILGYILWLIIYNVQLVTSKQCLKIYISELENSQIYFNNSY